MDPELHTRIVRRKLPNGQAVWIKREWLPFARIYVYIPYQSLLRALLEIHSPSLSGLLVDWEELFYKKGSILWK